MHYFATTCEENSVATSLRLRIDNCKTDNPAQLEDKMEIEKMKLKATNKLVPTEGERVKDVGKEEATEMSPDEHHWVIVYVTEYVLSVDD